MGLMLFGLLQTLLADAVSKRVLDAATTAVHLVRGESMRLNEAANNIATCYSAAHTILYTKCI